jgi:1,4-dihydroxy-6-naphthoate synthase
VERHRLPLPLGLNTIRRDLETRYGPGTLREVCGSLQRSVSHALRHRQASIEYALRFARGLAAEVADRFVSMYVNRRSIEFGPAGREAVHRFLAEVHAIGLIPDPGPIDFVDPDGSPAPSIEEPAGGST